MFEGCCRVWGSGVFAGCRVFGGLWMRLGFSKVYGYDVLGLSLGLLYHEGLYDLYGYAHEGLYDLYGYGFS